MYAREGLQAVLWQVKDSRYYAPSLPVLLTRPYIIRRLGEGFTRPSELREADRHIRAPQHRQQLRSLPVVACCHESLKC